DDDPAPLLLETLQWCMHRIDTAEYVAHHIGAMQTRGYAFAVADATINKRHVLDGVERRHIGVTLQRANFAFDRKFTDTLDELVAHLPVGDEIRNGDARQTMLLGESPDGIAAH